MIMDDIIREMNMQSILELLTASFFALAFSLSSARRTAACCFRIASSSLRCISMKVQASEEMRRTGDIVRRGE